jgi:putative acetyltransferase
MSAVESLTLRRLTADDNQAIASVIRRVSAEYGLTADKGYTVADPNLDELYQVYSQPGHAYWVIELNGAVAGGGGIAPLSCSEPDICELQKMYFLPSVRGKGMAKKAGADGAGTRPRAGIYALLSGNHRLFTRGNRPV